jgi:hypothetical protein
MSGLTAGDLLEQAGVDLDRELRDRSALGAIAGRHPHAWDGAYGRLAGLARGFLVTDLAAALLVGIGKTQELLRAAEHTRDTDDAETVGLLERHFTLAQHPSVDLLVQGTRVRTVAFTLTVDIDVVALAASVQRARIVHLTGGPVDLHVRFCLGELLLGEAVRRIDPHLEIALGPGWDLLPALESAPRNAPALRGADTAG